MGIKRLFIDLAQQPEAEDYFKYKIYINGSILVYFTGQNEINLEYKAGGDNSPFQIGIRPTLAETAQATLDFLISQYYLDGSIGGYSTSVGYSIAGNTIQVTIYSNAPDDLITIWGGQSTPGTILLKAESPCTQTYISNVTLPAFIPTPLFNPAYFPNGNYVLKNLSLGTQKNVTIPNKFDTLLDRGFSYSLLQDGATLANFGITGQLLPENISMYFTGNTLYINSIDGNDLKYSLDGITYQTGNTFPGLAVGDYTLYTKDNFGCVKTFQITNSGEANPVNEFTAYDFISESNSIRFKKKVDWGNCGNYKTTYNTLSCEENVLLPNKFTQLFQSCDTSIKTQIKTSYDNVEVGAGEINIPAVQIVKNIALEDRRDAYYYFYNGNMAVTFYTGNKYTYDTYDVIGNYALNGLLPEFGKIGNWVETPLGSFQIIDIRIADDGVKSLILNFTENILVGISFIQTIYNRENFNIWEFEINMSDFINTEFTVGVMLTMTEENPDFPTVFYISEKISVRERWARSTEFIWYNTENTDIYYFSGIVMKNRLNLCFLEALSDGTVDTQDTDTAVIPIDATDYKAWQLKILNLTTGMKFKIEKALKHNVLLIEGVAYTLVDNPNSERIGLTNFYTVTAKLKEAGDAWNQGTPGDQKYYSDVELIGLLQGDGDAEYIRII